MERSFIIPVYSKIALAPYYTVVFLIRQSLIFQGLAIYTRGVVINEVKESTFYPDVS
jgi:hypothetical protein